MAVIEQTRQARPERLLLVAVAAALWAVGWAAGKTCTAIWLSAAWLLAALKLGWSDARGTPGRR